MTDWAFISKFELRAQIYGDYITGIMVETLENGSPVRYAFGIENGTQLVVKRVTSSGIVSTLSSTSYVESEVEIRIRREGTSLRFERMIDGTWTFVRATGLASSAVAQKAGMFTTTDTSQRLRTAFDFAVLVDPSASSDLRENLRLTEIMYDPNGGSEHEFVELYNMGDVALDLTDVSFTEGITYTFGNIILGPRQYIVVVKNQAEFASRYSLSGVNVAPGNFAGRLDGDGETIELSDANGDVILEVTYGVDGDWPSDAKNTGRSLEVEDPAGNLNSGANWRASADEHGSPGRAAGGSVGTVIVNEVLTHSDNPLEDAIELRNTTGADMDISGWFLSDSASEVERFRIPNGTVIPAGGFKVFYEQEFNTNNPLVPFSLSSVNGDEVYLSAADGIGNLTGYRNFVEFGAAENGVTFGVYETTIGRQFTAMESRTFGMDNPASLAQFRTGEGLPNSGPQVGPVVINELMYHPPDIGGTNDNVGDEFIELFNITSSSVNLFDPVFTTNAWRLRGGADFDFPSGVVLPPHGYLLVVSFDPVAEPATLSAFRANYGLPVGVTILGPYQGKLDNSGESIRLRKPDTPQGPGPNEGFVPYVLVDEVEYADQAPWASSPDGSGDSLQRRRPHDYGNDPVNWKGEAPTPGRANSAGSGFTDTDGDGMSDSYETANGLNPNNPGDAGSDADSDGVSNYDECLAGTDPQDDADFIVAPVITIHPADAVTTAGGNANFNVSAGGTLPFQYQWRLNGTAIPGETNSFISIVDAQASAAGGYSVVVQNDAGFAISEPGILTVNQPLEIIGQPSTQVVEVGSDVSFTRLGTGNGHAQLPVATQRGGHSRCDGERPDSEQRGAFRQRGLLRCCDGCEYDSDQC